MLVAGRLEAYDHDQRPDHAHAAGIIPVSYHALDPRGRGRRPHRKEARSALVSLCESYWYPLYAYLRRRGYPADQAQDLTQDSSSACWKADISIVLTRKRAASAPFC